MRLYTSLFVFGLAAPCFPQAMLDHAAAATGGAMGALAGKSVSQGLGKVLNKVETTTAKAAKAKPDTSKTKESSPAAASRTTASTSGSISTPGSGGSSSFQGYGSATSSEGMPASSGGVTRHNRPLRQAPTEEAASEGAVAPVPPPIPVHHASLEEVVAIQPGTTRRVVLAKLGPPASMVTIPDDGHLLETFKYVSGSNWIGTVRLDNGSVVKVDSAAQ